MALRPRIILAVALATTLALTTAAGAATKKTYAGGQTAGAGLAHGATAPGARATQTAPPAIDSLWVLSPDGTTFSVCQNPTAPASISGCFGADQIQMLPATTTSTKSNDSIYQPTTDGTNVYFGAAGNHNSAPGYSCPISGYGQGCTQVQIGWLGYAPRSVAAAGGYLWLANGSTIYRCPSNLPYSAATSMPAGCELLDDAGSRGVLSLAYANGVLYAGLSQKPFSASDNHSIIWACDPNVVNSCRVLNTLGKTGVQALAVGGGYLWAGLGDGTILKCSPSTANACLNWEQAGLPIESLANDDQGTLWAAAGATNGVIWSCPETFPNGCTNVFSNIGYAHQVTAASGNAFSVVANGSTQPTIAFGATQYPQSVVWATNAGQSSNIYPPILYVPSGGPTALGGVRVQIRAPKAALARTCAQRGTLRARVVLRGPHMPGVHRALNLCLRGRPVRNPSQRFDLLSPRTYSVWVRSAVFSGTAKVTVTKEQTVRRVIRLRAPRRSAAARSWQTTTWIPADYAPAARAWFMSHPVAAQRR